MHDIRHFNFGRIDYWGTCSVRVLTRTFQIQDPLLIDHSSYRVRAQIEAMDDLTPPKPIIAEFTLCEKVAVVVIVIALLYI